MPIKGLVPTLAERGKIKIGGKGQEITSSKTGKKFRPPQKYDHFVITTMERDSNGDLIIDKEMMEEIGEDCKCLDVFLLYDDTNLNFPHFLAHYTKRKCICRGDGEKAIRLQENGERKEVECKASECSFKDFQEARCKANGILSVCLANQQMVGGVYKLRSTSWHTIRNLVASMQFIQYLTNGVLSGIPLQLRLQPRSVYPKKSETAQKIFTVNLEYPGPTKQLVESALDVARIRGSSRVEMKQIEADAVSLLGKPETEDEIEDIEGEFYPPEEGHAMNRDGAWEEEIELQSDLSPEEQAQMKKADALFKKLDWLIGKAHACKKNYEGNLPGLIEYLEKQLKVAKTAPPKGTKPKESQESIESVGSVESGEPEEPKKEVTWF